MMIKNGEQTKIAGTGKETILPDLSIQELPFRFVYTRVRPRYSQSFCFK